MGFPVTCPKAGLCQPAANILFKHLYGKINLAAQGVQDFLVNGIRLHQVDIGHRILLPNPVSAVLGL